MEYKQERLLLSIREMFVLTTLVIRVVLQVWSSLTSLSVLKLEVSRLAGGRVDEMLHHYINTIKNNLNEPEPFSVIKMNSIE